ncbi:MAG: septum formation protein Maf [Candidatus Goldiibacteriota bacterium HGW-Goldbacteria-1]|jgi:septum formation protein|nr:MAG: septum formation protein Maf [Candidatus Goldiibacteriota bacterium HGW-Goldbacteria-1]
MQTLILASTSPRRKDILKQFGIKFKVIAPDSDEEAVKKSLKTNNPYEIANIIAYEKAKSVLPKVKKGIILGSDTIVVLKGEILGKPKNKKDAISILSKLSSNTHSVITSIALIDAQTGKSIVTYDESRIYFKKMSPAAVKKYIDENHVLDKAGAYAIQENSDPFVRKTTGSYYNIVGLPIEKLITTLKLWDRI